MEQLSFPLLESTVAAGSSTSGPAGASKMNPIPAVDKTGTTEPRSGSCWQVQIDATDAPRKSDSEESDCEAATVAGSETTDADVAGVEVVAAIREQNRYVRLQEEHVEAVVILKNPAARDDFKGIGDVEALLKSNGKLTFNLTPEQLGVAGGSASSGAVTDGHYGDLDKCSSRKSSFRRNSLYSNQSDLEKQLLMEKPKPVPEIAGMYDVPKKILLPMFSEDQDFMDMNNFYDKNSQLKFDEIL